MKREGRQHGVVRTFGVQPDLINPRPEPRSHKLIASPPTAGSFSKVSSRPTNHSKPTGKPIPDPANPVPRPKDKIKGAHKLRSGDVALNHRLLDWRLVAAGDYMLHDDYYDDDE